MPVPRLPDWQCAGRGQWHLPGTVRPDQIAWNSARSVPGLQVDNGQPPPAHVCPSLLQHLNQECWSRKFTELYQFVPDCLG